MRIDQAYVDTGILGAYYCPEPLSAKAERALRAIHRPVISTLTEVEFTSLIARKRRLKDFADRQAREILRLFSSHVADGFYRRASLGVEHFVSARELIGRLQVSLHTVDALHLAVAIAESIPIMTADQSLAQAARQHKAGFLLVT